MFTRHGSRNLNIWAPLASLALVALFATPALRASFAGLVGGSAALFVLVTVLSLISGSREGVSAGAGLAWKSMTFSWVAVVGRMFSSIP